MDAQSTSEFREPGAGPRPPRRRASRPLWTLLIVAAAAVLGLLIVKGIQARTKAETGLARETDQAAIPTVRVIVPKRGAPADELTLPANAEAFTDTPVYARTNGYLKAWHVDIGARVKGGQLLAEIETPEVDQQYEQARAELETAKANLQLARSTSERWQFLRKTDSVSQQETDEKAGDLAAKLAAFNAAGANVKRLEEMRGFQKIYAPFDGVITARNIDIGSLINAGSAGTAKELFHLAAINRMRVYVQVPQVNGRAASPGTQASVTLSEMPGRQFHGRVVRTSNAIDPASRTLNVEVDVDNPQGLLLPGAYVEVHLKLPAPVHALTVPVNALLFRSEGMSVAAVRNSHVVLERVTIGHDYGNELEVTSGLHPDDQLIVDPPDSIVNGEQVEVAHR